MADLGNPFPGQFLLWTGGAVRVPDGYTAHRLGGWHLATDLPTAAVVGPDGEPRGRVVGWAMSPAGSVVTRLDLPPTADAAEETEAFEDLLYQHGGRYACVARVGGSDRLYLDPAGSLAAVYAADARSAGSTTTLLAWAHDRPPVQAGVVTNGFQPAGLTADPAVRRLLPNHYLDLAGGRPVRHHLHRVPDRVGTEADVRRLIGEVADALRAGVVAASAAGPPPALGLTAGRDSRMLLAAARPVKARLDAFTFDYPATAGDANSVRFDVGSARALCRRLGVAHRVLPVSPASPELREEYRHRIGYAGNSGKARDFLQTCRAGLDPLQPLVTGFGGEVGRAYYWGPPGADQAVTPDDLLLVMKLPVTPAAVEAVAAWAASFESDDRLGLLDMLYLEQRLGCWAGPHTYGFANTFNFSPFTHRRVFDAVLRLPADYRRGQRLAEDVVRRWPDLAGLPYHAGLSRTAMLRRKIGSLWDRGRRALRFVAPPGRPAEPATPPVTDART